jgi:hypothetical protein
MFASTLNGVFNGLKGILYNTSNLAVTYPYNILADENAYL